MSARNPFEVVMILTGLLDGIIGLLIRVIPGGKAPETIYGLQPPLVQVFYACLVLGTGTVALSLFLRPPMTLLIEQVGMIWLAALLVPYGVGLIISLGHNLDPTWVLVIGFGVACAARSLQITYDLRRYRRELRRVTHEPQ
ncbi:MAG: hypothetical protein ACRDQ4_11365 [Pseudonocardiaceae bacterium]